MDLGYGAWRRLYIVVIHSSNAPSQRPRQCTWPKARNNRVVHEDEQEFDHGILRHNMLQPRFLADLGRPIPGMGG